MRKKVKLLRKPRSLLPTLYSNQVDDKVRFLMTDIRILRKAQARDRWGPSKTCVSVQTLGDEIKLI